ncbi:hypothetical protein A3E65_00480 [Candidatus Kaiserbacteria bacterium RIFCSPHIGHO2_12_FULL_56_13]|uniref:Uncharacterized protein n=2 Tax=Candidatus Kaiseribacteriota TaxID=1752734 RepID=A0A1F6E3N3_9BACT|nr:MAG: hypothetical protein A3C95_02445 [Candidatus Kaiserbacteria bacterium RIFCSPHIGHO2_02_FULL_56_30]OGG72305.1 MAG: hypothetical protein A3E65_00480 [Candidatus Kaiserbacteria bacterium RIFCSPHIGHO2_12_FULL_56_13]
MSTTPSPIKTICLRTARRNGATSKDAQDDAIFRVRAIRLVVGHDLKCDDNKFIGERPSA